MKGVVFVELIRMAESVMGEEAVDDILESVDLESDGAFSVVGNYPCSELMALVDAFGTYLDAPVDALQAKFGHWMFARFVEGYPAFFEGKHDGFDMLDSIENEVHVEVRKLYPEVELPTFATERPGEGQLKMVYASERPLQHFCRGMLESCMDHFGHTYTVDMQESSAQGQHRAEFLVQKVA
ncbi:heme NO-binding domain-containing protein [Shimia haliotis]|uniref:Haem-NO-binding n=1 Tax=Shimia haliotis TaxID=1280847 RepID=A0A1I4CDY7_9RHOB|nr:heme NO-binding domain-containing protein [Shimia haliotis]SFK79412.1 Haem-NO-binding [Shimia haliotis]